MYKLLSIFLFATQVNAAPIPSDWIAPEVNTTTKSKNQADYSLLQKRFDSIMDLHSNVLNTQESKEDKKWKLQSIKTELGVEAEGEIGLLGTGGEAALELVWIKKQDPTRGGSGINKIQTLNEEIDEEVNEVVGIHSQMTNEDLVNELNPIIKIAQKTNKINNINLLRSQLLDYAQKFQEVTKAIEAAGDTRWYAYKYQLELYVNASGKVNPVMSAGSKFRVRLEWWRLRNQNISKPTNTKLLQNANFITSIAQDLNNLETVKMDNGFKLSTAKVGVGLGIEGKIFVAKAKGSVLGAIFFLKDEKMNTVNKFNTVVPYLLDGQVFPKEKFQKGMTKAANIASVISTLAGKPKTEDKFNLSVIEIEFELFAEGGIGILTAKGISSLTLFVTRGVQI